MSWTIKFLFVIVILLWLSKSAAAFWIQAQSDTSVVATTNFNAASIELPLPCNNSVDCSQVVGMSSVIYIIEKENQNPITLPSGYTFLCGGSQNWNGITSQFSVIYHQTTQGEPNPTFSWIGTVHGSIAAINYFGINLGTSVDKCVFQDYTVGGTTTTATMTAPDPGTPSLSNDEDLMIYLATGSHSSGVQNMTVSDPSNLTTMGSTTIQRQLLATPPTAAPPEMFWYETNLGWGIPADPGATTILASLPVLAAGMQLLLKSVVPLPFTGTSGGATAAAKASGVYTLNGLVPTPDFTDWTKPFLDGSYALRAWNETEPNCHIFDWDFLDNFILDSRIYNNKFELGAVTGIYSPTWIFSQTPDSHTTCAGEGVQSGVLARWAKEQPSGAIYQYDVCTPYSVAPPYDPNYEAAYADLMYYLGQRYSSIPNITIVKNSGVSSQGIELKLTNPVADGATLTCNDTPANCALIPGVTCASGPAAPCTCTQYDIDSVEWPSTTPPFTILAVEGAYRAFENDILTNFPNVAIGVNTNSNPMPTVTGGGSQNFNSDSQAYDESNYPGKTIWDSDCVGPTIGTGLFNPCNTFVPIGSNIIATGRQPGAALWSVSPQVEADPLCNVSPAYSLSANNCLIPAIYSGLNDNATEFEMYIKDLQNPAAASWDQMTSDYIAGREGNHIP